MAGNALYDDGRVCLDAEALTLRRYYFPFATSKRIPYSAIRGVDVRPLTWLTGKGRLWGSAHPRYWLPLDATRLRKDTAVVLDLGGRVRPTFTPDDPERVRQLLHRSTG
ncbi:hypothetical protein [Blastococcus tunisiensis]|jgi:hypothetical protein|uniref:PH domain-containing protein n=1 Tax=Blastococcus tunisiensis TaxID=1798228 RepID=A0A1I2B6H7_9ACTN|nr:hypothetical protein [Blastococcus sp. DSM 46838]SFE50750.1 hypothetical protein SAMN05216574_10443 [Blastococcus sp. DSM 46838]